MALQRDPRSYTLAVARPRCWAWMSSRCAALLILAVIALLSIVNTLALTVAERTRELGLLRAIGMPRSQLAQMITAESVIIAVLGLGLGTALAAASPAPSTRPWRSLPPSW